MPLRPSPYERRADASAGWTLGADDGHGEVFTRRWVVDLILDAVGYCSSSDLTAMTIVEPACGCGAFLTPIVERLVASAAKFGHSASDLAGSIRAFDLMPHNAEIARKTVIAQLVHSGFGLEDATSLATGWVVAGDFLLATQPYRTADFVVGNPPYIRLEDVPSDVMTEYRARYRTMKGRSDIYVAFFEQGLSLLKPEGRLGFICADRWMRNQYGAALREMISADFALDATVSMHDVDAFDDQVSAYPAVTILRRGPQRQAKVVEANGGLDEKSSKRLGKWLGANRAKSIPLSPTFEATTLSGWFDGAGHWPSARPHHLELIGELEARFPTLQDPERRTRVGIGVATGCDEVFLVSPAPRVEADRLLPLVAPSDIASGEVIWKGKYLVNPWRDGALVDLADYPDLSGYLSVHKPRLLARHIAKKRPSAWYRTIDRVDPELQQRPKLLLPDIKASAHPVLDTGGYYPHHNLYVVVSDEWDLEVLGGLLLSNVANLFVGAYCVRMRGGTYRFQALYLRQKPDGALTLQKADATYVYTAPADGWTWTLSQYEWEERKRPDWATVVGIIGLLFFLIGIVFFFIKETVRHSGVQLTVTTADGVFVAQYPDGLPVAPA